MLVKTEDNSAVSIPIERIIGQSNALLSSILLRNLDHLMIQIGITGKHAVKFVAI